MNVLLDSFIPFYETELMTNQELARSMTDLEIMYLTIVGEARGEPVEGQIAVANVIINRTKTRKLSIKEVCLQPLQFSCWNEDDPNRAVLMEIAKKILLDHDESNYKQIQWVTTGVENNIANDNTHGMNYYMTTKLFNSPERPNWAKIPKTDPVIIGNQTFFNV